MLTKDFKLQYPITRGLFSYPQFLWSLDHIPLPQGPHQTRHFCAQYCNKKIFFCPNNGGAFHNKYVFDPRNTFNSYTIKNNDSKCSEIKDKMRSVVYYIAE